MKGGDMGMKRPVSNKALMKEAALWDGLKKAMDVPGKICSK
jgi:hypothetical protein